MAAKRKSQGGREDDDDSSILPHKRHENTTSQDATTYCSTESSYGVQWYEQRGQWIALYDWNSGHYYYQNISDHRTQWEQPADWGSIHPLYIPVNQYSAGFWNESVNREVDTSKDVHEDENYKISVGNLEAKVQLFLSRPARRQIDPEEKKKLHWIPEGATEYNIWYDRWVGEHWRADKDHGQLCS